MDHYSYVSARSKEVLAVYEQHASEHSLEEPVGADGRPELSVAQRIEDVALDSGLEVVEYPDLPEDVLGELDTGDRIICVRPGLDPRRRSFIIAHEIGHYTLGHEGRIVDSEQHIDERVGPDELAAQDGVHRAYNSRDFKEIEANLFAAELLAPTTLLLESIEANPGWSPEKLAEAFGISLTAMLTRLANVLLLGNRPEEAAPHTPEESGPAASTTAASFLPELHHRQKEAVDADTPALVVAGPGAGKTRVLAERYAHLVRSGVRPEEILALTFSNKAAEEMRTRVALMLGQGTLDEFGNEEAVQRVRAYTFHGFGLELLKGYYHLLGLPEDFTLLTETDALLLVRSRLSELELAHFENLSDPGLHLPDILAAISRAKDELRSPNDFERLAREMHAAVGDTNGAANDENTEEWREAAGKAVEAAKIYRAYQGWLEESGYVDYGDLVRLAVEALGVPGAAEDITEGYRHILVDEFQDINFASGRMLRALDRGRGVVWAVADPDQSIYRFRGASPANLERFGEDYPGYRTIHLTQNYRSNPDIVGCSQGVRQGVALPSLHAVLAEDEALPGEEAGTAVGSSDGQPPPLESARGAGEEPAVSLAVAPDGEAELGYLVGQVRSRTERGVPLGDQAVLCSTNAQARAIVARLSAAGLEAQGPVSLLGSAEIKDALAVVSLLRAGGSAGAGGASLVRVAGFEENPLTEQDAGTVVRWARKQQLSVREALGRGPEVDGLDEAASAYLAELGRFLDELPGWGDAYHAILAYAFHPDSRVRNLLTDSADASHRRLLSLGQLAILARTFADREDLVEEEGISGFLEYVRELAASKKGDGALYIPPATTSKSWDGGATDAVQVMTVHKSKGLEFPVVYVPNLARGRFPVRMGGGGKRSSGEPVPVGLAHHAESQDNEQEDRCLFYVALTRAEDELVLSRAERYGRATRRPIPLIDGLVREANGRMMVLDHAVEDSDGAEASVQGLHWSPLSDSDVAHSGSKAYSFRQIDRYGKCSLQFKYAEVLELAEERSGYQDFHNCVYQALSEMELEARRTGENPSLPWAMEQFGRIWEEEGPAGHYYEPVYRRRAQKVVENWQAAGRALTWRLREKIEPPLASPVVGETQLEVTADAIGRGEIGELLVARHRFGRPRKSHMEGEKQDLLALYAAAGRSRYAEEVRVVLHYLVGDEIVEATPTDRVISNRLKKISGRVEGARAGRYPPSPGQICKSCQYNLICPASR